MTDDLVKRLRNCDYAIKTPDGHVQYLNHVAADRIEQLEAALREIDKATISHVDGRDLLDELHPRNTLDIQRRIDGIDTWFEGDWLSNLRDARNAARAALGEKKDD